MKHKEKRSFKKVDKFIFLGTLLGRHIPKIAEKIDASSYLVLERNLEIFQIVSFYSRLYYFSKKGAIFSIMDNHSEEEKKIYTIFECIYNMTTTF